MEDKQISDPEKQQLGVMRLNDQKAGMQGLDVTKINQIIDEASKGSKFYQHKMKRYLQDLTFTVAITCNRF